MGDDHKEQFGSHRLLEFIRVIPLILLTVVPAERPSVLSQVQSTASS